MDEPAADGHLARRLFGAMLRRIEALPAPAGCPELETRQNP